MTFELIAKCRSVPGGPKSAEFIIDTRHSLFFENIVCGWYRERKKNFVFAKQNRVSVFLFGNHETFKMDFQNRVGAKTGGGGVASWSESNRDRRERLRQLALETIDLAKDPYFMKNHLGSYECKLCLTLHNNEGSYLAHTQGKKHQSNLARRAAKDAKDAPQPQLAKSRIDIRKFVKIGRPGYRVTKQFDQDLQQQSLLFQVI